MVSSVHSSRWVFLLVAVALMGCEEGVEHPKALGDVLRERGAVVEKAVVTVDDRAVDVSEFRAFWNQRPKLPREAAVDAFIEHEVMYAPALEGGFADREAVAVARKRAMVRHLLERTVEQDVTEETLDEQEIDKIAAQVEGGVGHPVGLRASHILVSVPEDKKAEKGKKQPGGVDREAAYQQARAVLDEIRDALPETPTPFDLMEARRQFSDQVEEPQSVVVNAHLRFPVVEVERSTLPDGWLNVVPDFRKPAVEMARRGAYGVLSEPVRSPFGWHLIVVHEKLPGAEPDPDAVREVAVARLLQQKRSEEVRERFEEWSKSADTRSFPNVIEEAEELE
ncbi:MAG: peptidylprolyl isomerase [Myxococcota bacterium]